jgi:hypothetical protein
MSDDLCISFARWNAAVIAAREAANEYGLDSAVYRHAARFEALAFVDFAAAGGIQAIGGYAWSEAA